MRADATAFTTKGVWENGEAILLVTHDPDGTWQFMPGSNVELDDGLALHLGHIVDRHPDLASLADLPPGWAAERETSVGDWTRFQWPD